ncbi:hypothetical protein KAX97_10745 [candidate division WOR-3 bacterium]|nr:hypothetical protein [candidate division WOR-3 bacterium]
MKDIDDNLSKTIGMAIEDYIKKNSNFGNIPHHIGNTITDSLFCAEKIPDGLLCYYEIDKEYNDYYTLYYDIKGEEINCSQEFRVATTPFLMRPLISVSFSDKWKEIEDHVSFKNAVDEVVCKMGDEFIEKWKERFSNYLQKMYERLKWQIGIKEFEDAKGKWINKKGGDAIVFLVNRDKFNLEYMKVNEINKDLLEDYELWFADYFGIWIPYVSLFKISGKVEEKSGDLNFVMWSCFNIVFDTNEMFVVK